ncbi:MAG: FkbM family methyltransferase [Bacteroidetes bacterium]|nr:FkbM family methyltransferase [Bacteroidota bacterium]
MNLKKLVKHSLYALIPKKNGYSKVKVLKGPAKGAYLNLDLRIEGSYFLGNYDAWIFEHLPFADFIKPGNIVWDCGAYVGYYTACFRKLTGESGTVHTFEASKPNYERLKSMPENNRWNNVHIHYMAVGPEHSTLEFVDNLGGASGPYNLDKQYNESREELVVSKVQCCGVDELCYEQKIGLPDFIKFDLESAEVYALHNGHRLFTEKRPYILLELHGESAKTAAGQFLDKYNYEAVFIEGFKSKRHGVRSQKEFDAIPGVPHMIMCLPL